MRETFNTFYEYGGRTFATIAAAYSYKQAKDWFKENNNPYKIPQFFIDRSPQSWTTTSTKKKEEEKMYENVPSNVHLSKQVFKANGPLRRVAPGNIEYRDYYNYELEFFAMSKASFALCFVGTKSQYTVDSTNENMAGFSNKKWFDLAPDQGQVAGQFVPANTNPGDQWLGCSVADVKMDYINLSTLPCEVTVTWFRAVVDQSETPLEIYNESELSNLVYTTNFATNPAIVDEPTTGGNEVSLSWTAPSLSAPESLVTMPYINLGSRKNIKSSWTKLSTKKTIMAGGSTWRLSNNGYVNCFQKKSIVTDAAMPAYPKGCVVAIVSFQGFGSHAVIPLAGPQPLTNEPILAPGKIGVVISRHLYLKTLKPSVNKYDMTYIGVGTVPVRGSVTQMSVVETDMAVAIGEVTT